MKEKLFLKPEYLKDKPIHTKDDLEVFEAWQREQKHSQPLIADNSVDLIVSNRSEEHTSELQ